MKTRFSQNNILTSFPRTKLVVDKDGTVLDAGETLSTIYAIPSQSVIGTKLQNFYEGKEKQKLNLFLNRVLNSEAPTKDTFSYFNDNRVPKQLEHVGIKQVEASEQSKILLYVSDVSEYHKTKKLLDLQNQISKALTFGKSLEDSIYKIMKAIGNTYKLGGVILWVPDEDGILRYKTSWYIPSFKESIYITTSKKGKFKNGEGAVGKSYYTKKVKLITHLDEDNRITYTRKPEALATRIKSVVFYPLILNRKSVGVLEFICRNRDRNYSELLETLDSLEHQIAQLVTEMGIEEKLVRSEERYKTLINMAPDIIYLITPDGKIRTLNSAFEKLTGFKQKDFIGKNINQLLCEEDRLELNNKLSKIHKSKDTYEFQAELVNKHNKQIIGEFRETAKIINGRLVTRLGIIRDITVRENLEKQKDVWVSLATHELKTPLTSIKAFTQILQSKVKTIQAKDDLQTPLKRIEEVVNRMNTIINDFLDSTTIRSQGLSFNFKRISFNQLLTETVRGVKFNSTTHSINLDIEKDLIINGDKTRLSQLITNLMDNAIKYSPNATKIDITAKRSGEELIVSIRDYGMGIEKGNIKKIFNLYYRTDASQRKSGYGLGLFICEAIVKGHKGRLWVESEPGKGTVFSFSLPLVKSSKEK